MSFDLAAEYLLAHLTPKTTIKMLVRMIARLRNPTTAENRVVNSRCSSGVIVFSGEVVDTVADELSKTVVNELFDKLVDVFVE